MKPTSWQGEFNGVPGHVCGPQPPVVRAVQALPPAGRPAPAACVRAPLPGGAARIRSLFPFADTAGAALAGKDGWPAKSTGQG